jgi:hypothetical protein
MTICGNCGNAVSRQARGWTHVGEWQGVRCPRRLSRAEPEVFNGAHSCHEVADFCILHHDAAGNCLSGCQKEPMDEVRFTPQSPKQRRVVMDAIGEDA